MIKEKSLAIINTNLNNAFEIAWCLKIKPKKIQKLNFEALHVKGKGSWCNK
tara:strand:- start:621 stop:773 length:153 start_codon:yes stop_codon:yes gene_type:complete